MQRAFLLCIPVLLVACGAPSEPPASNVIGDPLEQSLEKARSVDALSGQRKDGLDESIDEAN